MVYTDSVDGEDVFADKETDGLAEDMTQRPVLTDKWTIMMAAILLVNVIVMAFSKKKYNSVEEEGTARN